MTVKQQHMTATTLDSNMTHEQQDMTMAINYNSKQL